MDLKEFIKETITQIVEGVVAADVAVKEHDAGANPQAVTINPDGHGTYGVLNGPEEPSMHRRAVTLIGFDVVLTVTEGSELKGGLGLHVGAVAFGGAKKADHESSSESRVKFSIPLALPVSKNLISPKGKKPSRSVTGTW